MAVVASAIRARGRLRHPWVWVGLASFGAAYVYAAMRVASGWTLYGSITAPCSFLALTTDHACTPLGANAVAGRYVLASVLVGLSLAVPGVVLAMAGRRLVAFVPLAAATVATVALAPVAWIVPSVAANARSGVRIGLIEPGSDPSAGFWTAHALLAGIVDVAIIAVPAAAIIGLVRPAQRWSDGLDRRAAIRAALVCGGGIVGVIAVASWFGFLPGVSGQVLTIVGGTAWVVPCATIVAFGAALGTDRRLWPWVLAPAALLLSGAPSQLLISQLWGYTDTSSFGSVLPLTIVGLIASGWAPLAARWSRSMAWAEGDAGPRPAPRRRRWLVISSNGVGIGLLLIAVLAVAFSPLPAQLAEALPTYAGLRSGAQDLRAKMNLEQGLAAMDSFRTARGSYAGFGAAAGRRVEPGLAWQDRLPTRFGAGATLTVHVIAAEPRRAELVTLSESGSAFCIREARAAGHRAAITYGVGLSSGAARASGRPGSAVAAAVAACGSIPWSPAAVRPIDISSICDLASERSQLACQAVKRLVIETIWKRTPPGR
jgi:hypothetical protein